MKRANIYLPVLMFGLFFIFISGCTTTPTESCVQEDFCPGKTVTACCTDTECSFEYNGVKYGDDQESKDKLADLLGCVQASAPTYKEDISDLVLRLDALSEIARSNSIKH